MPVDVAAVSYVLSSMASVGRILESVNSFLKRGRSPTPAEFEQIEKEAHTAVSQQMADGAYRDGQLARSMSEEIIETIRAEMDRIKERLKRIVIDPRLNGEQKIAAATIEQDEFCKHLMLVKKFNGGKLPVDLEEMWQLNGCGKS